MISHFFYTANYKFINLFYNTNFILHMYNGAILFVTLGCSSKCFVPPMVLKSNQEPIWLKLHVGDIVELNEESEGIAYARIKSIFRHQANNDKYYAFFLFDWFEATNTINRVLECPLYNIQKPEDSRWFRIFPIDFIVSIPCVHFIHNCTNACNTEHDETNRSYILNHFYYKAV